MQDQHLGQCNGMKGKDTQETVPHKSIFNSFDLPPAPAALGFITMENTKNQVIHLVTSDQR